MFSRFFQLQLQLPGVGRTGSPEQEIELRTRRLSSESIDCWTRSLGILQLGQDIRLALNWPAQWTQGRSAVLEAQGAVSRLQAEGLGGLFSVGLDSLPLLRFKDDGPQPAGPPAILQPLGFNMQAFGYYSRLRRIRQRLAQNLSDPLSLTQAAELAGMEPTYFSDFFGRKVGVPFRRWLEHLRIERALELIHSRNHSITRVAHEAGFGSLRSLERAFKRRTGLSPTQYKKFIRPS